ncbi:phosphoglycerate kinase [Chloroflexota bacterium]
MDKRTIRDIELKGKRALMRVDFNVPLSINSSTISDDSRIRATIPTIKYLRDQGAMVILCSHMGKPKGKVVEKLKLAPVAERLSELLGLPVRSTGESIGPEVEEEISKLKDGDLLMIENLRFHSEEEKNDPEFARALARLGDVYVNDAFGIAHRAHASTEGITHYLPAVAGFLLEKEIDSLGKALTNPRHPFAAIIGGAKVSDKIEFLENIQSKVDYLLIGGGMCCTFLKAQGYIINCPIVEENKLDFACGLMEKATRNGASLLLPTDVIVSESFANGAPSKAVSIQEIPENWYVMDIGPQTLERFSTELRRCRTILWNGPMGVFELNEFRKGTEGIARLLAEVNATTIVGGGSTAEAVTGFGLVDKMTHVSTGGGASLKFLEGKTLPGVEALMDKVS